MLHGPIANQRPYMLTCFLASALSIEQLCKLSVGFDVVWFPLEQLIQTGLGGLVIAATHVKGERQDVIPPSK